MLYMALLAKGMRAESSRHSLIYLYGCMEGKL